MVRNCRKVHGQLFSVKYYLFIEICGIQLKRLGVVPKENPKSTTRREKERKKRSRMAKKNGEEVVMGVPYYASQNPYQAGTIPPNAVFGDPKGIPIQQTIYRDTPAPFNCVYCGNSGVTTVRSIPPFTALYQNPNLLFYLVLEFHQSNNFAWIWYMP